MAKQDDDIQARLRAAAKNKDAKGGGQKDADHSRDERFIGEAIGVGQDGEFYDSAAYPAQATFSSQGPYPPVAQSADAEQTASEQANYDPAAEKKKKN